MKQKIGSLKLVPSGGGAFEVSINGTRIYSKLETGEFPNPDAIVRAIQSHL